MHTSSQVIAGLCVSALLIIILIPLWRQPKRLPSASNGSSGEEDAAIHAASHIDAFGLLQAVWLLQRQDPDLLRRISEVDIPTVDNLRRVGRDVDISLSRESR